MDESSPPPFQSPLYEVPSVSQEITISSGDPIKHHVPELVLPQSAVIAHPTGKEKEKGPFIVFEGDVLQVSTADGRKYFIKNKKQPLFIYSVQLYGNEYDLEIQNPPKKTKKRKPKKGAAAEASVPVPLTQVPKAPIVVTLSDSDDSEVEILAEVEGTSRIVKDITIKIEPSPETEVESNPEPKGRMDRKRNNARNQAPMREKCKVFNIDNLSFAEEDEMRWYIHYIDSVVMMRSEQQRMWKTVAHLHVPASDPRLTKLAPCDVVEQEQLIIFCSIIKRAFCTFLRRAGAVYKFLYPQVIEGTMQEALIQLWQGLSNHERELFYFGKPFAQFKYEFIDILVRFPPGIFERKILSTVYPNGVKVDPVPSYVQIFSSFVEVKVEAEQRRQEEDMEALNRFAAQFFGHEGQPHLILNPHSSGTKTYQS